TRFSRPCDGGPRICPQGAASRANVFQSSSAWTRAKSRVARRWTHSLGARAERSFACEGSGHDSSFKHGGGTIFFRNQLMKNSAASFRTALAIALTLNLTSDLVGGARRLRAA